MAAQDKVLKEMNSIRDTVESIWIAIVLAFVLRAFMIEAFVIPTGSMAPRLMGAHWELRCPACGYEYAFGFGGTSGPLPSHPLGPNGAVCPNCGLRDYDAVDYVNNGDRVLVLKYLYRLGSLTDSGQPQPWDVVVFRNPQSNRENYIKRLVGLPGETIEIVHGKIFVRDATTDWHVRRKPPAAQEAMWQIVFENDYHPTAQQIDAGDSPSWQAAGGATRWNLNNSWGRVFEFKGGPTPEAIAFHPINNTFLPRYGYNDGNNINKPDIHPNDLCGDLKLMFTFVPQVLPGKAILQLGSLGHFYRAEVSTEGTAELLYRKNLTSKWESWGKASLPPMQVNKGYELALTNVDLGVALSVNGQTILSSSDDKYPENYRTYKEWVKNPADNPIPMPEVSIAAEGGACQLWHVRLLRDVYYTMPATTQPIPDNALGDFARRLIEKNIIPKDRVDTMSDGKTTLRTLNPITLVKHPESPELDEFFVLGDNSPLSLDGRVWSSAAPTLKLFDETGKQIYHLGTVPRYNLLGKAFFVYWPAGFRVPGLPNLPVIPNFGRMRFIR